MAREAPRDRMLAKLRVEEARARDGRLRSIRVRTPERSLSSLLPAALLCAATAPATAGTYAEVTMRRVRASSVCVCARLLLSLPRAVSSGERNGPGEDFTWFQPSECLSRAAVELSGDGVKLIL